MIDKSAAAIAAYIQDRYLTLDALAARAAIPAARIADLIAAHCVPPHSHEIRTGVTFHSEGFGAFTAAPEICRYYHPSLVSWIERAEDLARTRSLAAVAHQVRLDFEQAVLDLLDGAPLPWPRGIDHPWAFLMDGTFGLCLKDLTIANLVQKEAARATLANTLQAIGDGHPTAEQRDILEAAIARYDAATLPFAPHEIEASSRALEIPLALEKIAAMPKVALSA